ncbi:MAG: hypothetical protein ACP5HS_05655 [Anaerolineae bacterium]
MIIIREHEDESVDRICHIHQSMEQRGATLEEHRLYGIDEAFLAWIYVAPGYEGRESTQRLLALARSLIGANAWAVVQAAEAVNDALCREFGFRVVEIYRSDTVDPSGVSVRVTRTIQTGT